MPRGVKSLYGPQSQFPQSPEELRGRFSRRTPPGGCIWLLVYFIVGVFVIWTLIWLWDSVF